MKAQSSFCLVLPRSAFPGLHNMDLFAPPTAAELDARLAAAGIQAMAAAAAPPPPSHSSPPPNLGSATVALEPSPLPNAPVLPQWNPMDELWRSPVTGAGVYVGNRQAAMDERLLMAHKISTIIVCAGEQKRHHDEGKFKYVKRIGFHTGRIWQKFQPALLTTCTNLC